MPRLICLLTLCVGCLASALALPSGLRVQTVHANVNFISAMAVAPDGSIFFSEKGFGNPSNADCKLRTPAGAVSTFVRKTVDARGESGMLGVALDPAYASNGFVYIYYINSTPRVGRLARFRR